MEFYYFTNRLCTNMRALNVWVFYSVFIAALYAIIEKLLLFAFLLLNLVKKTSEFHFSFRQTFDDD